MNLLLCIHNHQPVGNMDFILEEAYMRAYEPFCHVLKEWPQVKINLHFSGYLFSWLLDHKPAYISLLKELVERGQLEIVSGGMYEPILALLPEEDGIEQLTMHQDLMKSTFHVKPRGCWLAERVYEPQIPKVLHKAGIAYTLVDDNHFKSIGLEDKDLYGHFISDFEGHPLLIFPGLEFLRYAIPFKPIEVLDEYLRAVHSSGGGLAVFGDDGEKFGLWPGTFDSVYKEGWLESFFKYLTENRSWLKTVTFSEHIEENPPKDRIYLDCASYMEMGEWSLPARLSGEFDELLHETAIPYRKFLRGGFYRYFLIKYSESNDMHKKMLRLSQKAGSNRKARKEILKAQANDSYWHGVFGGLYLPHLRASVYKHLIEAQRLLDPEKPFIHARIEDVNIDGHNEAVLSNNAVEATFLLKSGGVLYGLDHKPTSVNIMATLQRRYEGYHEKLKKVMPSDSADGTKTIHDLVLAKETGLENYLHYDWYRRASFVDHVMGPDADLESFYRCTYREPGDFVKEPYEARIRNLKQSAVLSLTRKGHFWRGSEGLPLNIKKTITLREGTEELLAVYIIESDLREPFQLGVEFNFAFLGSGGDRYLQVGKEQYPLTIKKEIGPDRNVICHDPYQQIDVLLTWDLPGTIWTFPVEVVSLSEQGFERNYQSTMIMPVWTVDPALGPKKISIGLNLRKSR